jgi:NitT/TauT family transport system substrate-binding protein
VSEPLLNGQAQFAASGVPPFLSLWDSTRDNIGVRALCAMNRELESPGINLVTTSDDVLRNATFSHSTRLRYSPSKIPV